MEYMLGIFKLGLEAGNIEKGESKRARNCNTEEMGGGSEFWEVESSS